MDEKSEKRKLYLKNYYKENREKRRLQLQEWRKANPEKNKEYSKKHREKNAEKIEKCRKTPEARAKMLNAVKNWRLKNKERHLETERIKKDRNKFKINSRFKVTNAVRRGHMIRPNKCEKCMKECKPEAHHNDYSKPLEVQWFCRVCHNKIHNKLMDIP